MGLLVAFQYREGSLKSSKSVPPTATLNAVEATPLTAKPNCAAVPSPPSHVAEPLSPEATTTVIPSEAACSHKAL